MFGDGSVPDSSSAPTLAATGAPQAAQGGFNINDPDQYKKLAMLMMAQGQNPMAGGRPNPLGIAAQSLLPIAAMQGDLGQGVQNMANRGSNLLSGVSGMGSNMLDKITSMLGSGGGGGGGAPGY